MGVIKNKLALVLVLLTAGIIISCSNTQNKTTDDGFTVLFNGEDFDGWYLKIRNGDSILAKQVFTADNGMVHVFKDLPDSLELNTGKSDTHGLFYTNKKFSRFILKFEYKWGTKIMNNFNQFQYDAGMYYHVYDDKIWPQGIEYQVRYNHFTDKNHTGDYWASGTSFQWFSADSSTFTLPSEGGKPMPIKSGEHLAAKNVTHNALNGEWNQCEVIVMGNKYSIHKLNGQIVNMAIDLSQSEGIIGFQSETAEIFYRNIMIKEFAEDVPMEDFLNK
jgi:hypothetical protein